MHLFTVATILLLQSCTYNNGFTRHEWDRINKYGSAYISWMQVASIDGDCVFHDYSAGGSKVKEVSKFTVSVAELEANVLAKIIGSTKTTLTTAAHTINAVKSITKIFAASAPALAPALGLIGTLMGGLEMGVKTKAADILKVTNRAFEEMTMEINERFDEMKGYVDSKFLQFEKRLLEEELGVMYRLWTYCLNEGNPDDKKTASAVNECQRDAYRHVFAKEQVFMKKFEHAGDVQRIEAALLPFREYAQLSLFILSTLVKTYKKDPNSKYLHKFFKTELTRVSNKFSSYAEKAVSFIIKHHGKSKKQICTETF